MRRLHADRLDAQSARDLDAALALATAYWAAEGARDAARRDGADLILVHEACSVRVRLLVEGPLMRLSRVLHDTVGLAFLQRIRFADRTRVARDVTLAPDARNALFVLRNGARRDVPSMTGLLVHELTHVRQALDLPARSAGFALAYAATLGRPFEREAYAAHRRATRFAAERV